MAVKSEFHCAAVIVSPAFITPSSVCPRPSVPSPVPIIVLIPGVAPVAETNAMYSSSSIVSPVT